VDCSAKDQKSVILRRACETVHKLQDKVSQLTFENTHLKAQRSPVEKSRSRRPSCDGLPLSLSPLSLKPISPLLLKRELSVDEFDPKGIFNCSAVGLMIVNLHGQIVDCNGKFCDVMGCSKGSLLEIGSSIFDPLHPAYLALSPSFVTNLVDRPSRTLRFRKRLLISSGINMNLQVTCWAICSSASLLSSLGGGVGSSGGGGGSSVESSGGGSGGGSSQGVLMDSISKRDPLTSSALSSSTTMSSSLITKYICVLIECIDNSDSSTPSLSSLGCGLEPIHLPSSVMGGGGVIGGLAGGGMSLSMNHLDDMKGGPPPALIVDVGGSTPLPPSPLHTSSIFSILSVPLTPAPMDGSNGDSESMMET